ncbi:MAG: NADH dehydrogenase (quinone) subunit G [Geobacter sp.]|nr:MAG: NADH dehydrogenase (quinone) subunit G [Geobacter sp.]
MPKLIIDNIPVEVPEGTNVLEAARSIGIVIPHFCWHPALGRAGACRACAVKMLDGPVKGLQMSCMLPAQDGMVVSTTDAEAMAMRRSVIEWLMINHPHDCPVCDEGGECQLQDFTIAGGHGIRRYDGRKRTYNNQYLGEFIAHEMNRCIQCYRCVRFYQEYAGGTDFGVMGRAAMVYFGRQSDGPLESPFSGNLVDICPTGVFTDKTARFRARYWDYDMAPSICPHCSLGCNITPVARYRELLKVVARRNDRVNGWFICDRGRFPKANVNALDRPRQPLVDGKATSWDEALDALRERLNGFLELNGTQSLAIIGSPRMSMEGNTMAARLHKLLDTGKICYFSDSVHAGQTLEAVASLTPDNAASQEDVRQADLVAIVGSDLLAEAPMMALAVRQAWRNGAPVYVVGEETSTLFEYVAVASLSDIPLAEAKHPVLICGTNHVGSDIIDTAARNKAKLSFILDGPNAFGCALLSQEYGATPLSEAVASGKIKGLISFESDLTLELPAGIRVLAAADCRKTPLLSRAEIVLPSSAWVEMDGTFINNEGRAQRFKQVMEPGLPIKGLDPAGHPPRLHRNTPPGGEVLPTWRIIAKITERLGSEWIEDPLSDQWERLRELDAEGEGISVV